MRRLRGGVAALAVLAALPAAAQEAPATDAARPMSDRRNGVAIFAGIYSPDVFSDIVTSPISGRPSRV